MRIRHDVTFVSAMLFTIALLSVVPSSLSAALGLRHGTPAPPYYWLLEPIGELGIVSLAMIAIGLVVIWTGYLKKARSAWFVLLTIVWGWAFPVMLVPFVLHLNGSITLAEWVSDALKQPGAPRTLVKSVLIFLLMIIALILPIKSFFWSRGAGGTTKELPEATPK